MTNGDTNFQRFNTWNEILSQGSSWLAVLKEHLRRTCDLLIEMKMEGSELALLAPYVVPCQLLGFFTGLAKGLNPDLPKNLSRVVILD